MSKRIKNKLAKKQNQNDFENSRLATVTATLVQLQEIGIDEDITGKEVRVYDVNKYSGMYQPCSRIEVDNKFVWLKGKGINLDYIFPTRWLSFSN